MKNPLIFCELFYASHYIPIAFFEEGQCKEVYGFPKDVRIHPSIVSSLLASNLNPGLYNSNEIGLYGFIRIVNSNDYFIVGPVFSSMISDEIIALFMRENVINGLRKSEMTQFLRSIPRLTYNQFLNVLAYLHYELNGEVISVTEHFAIVDMNFKQMIAAQHIDSLYQSRDYQTHHGTYHFEKRLLEYVRLGKPEALKVFLLNMLKNEVLIEGKLADSPLRQAKNLFIGSVTLVGKDGAIQGGLDVESTYHLIDTYIQECERLQSLEAIKNLQYNMLMDFTHRVAQNKLPQGVSNDVLTCIQFINSHINEAIGVHDVAMRINRSRSYTMSKFKSELGLNIGEYISKCKMEEAKTLLELTNKELSEISEYLCFSSQSYFQNLFKKTYGISPAKYRKAFIQQQDASKRLDEVES